MTTPITLQLFEPNRNEPIIDEKGCMQIRLARWFEIATNNIDILMNDPVPLALLQNILQQHNRINELETRLAQLEATYGL